MNQATTPAPTPRQQDPEGLQGVFSREEQSWIGSGTTRRKTTQRVNYHAQQNEQGDVEFRPLNVHFLPHGDAQTLPLDEFLVAFKPEPELYKHKTMPALREVTKNLAKGERLRGQGQPLSAELAFKTALNMDAENVRGNFGLGITYLDQGKNDEAAQLLRKIVSLSGSFKPENKHLFNEFGIRLRKSGMYDQALSYYASAYKVAPKDENLCYNIARTLVEKGEYAVARKYLEKALVLQPGFPEAGSLLKVVLKELAKTGAV